MATENRGSCCCWGCLTEQLHPQHFWAAGEGRAVLHTWHGQQQVWNECSLHTGAPASPTFPWVHHKQSHKTLGKPQNPTETCNKPHGTLRKMMLQVQTAPAQNPGQALPLPASLTWENSLFAPRCHRPSGAHYRGGEFPRIHGFSASS